MTEKLYDRDSFIKSFTATVLDCIPQEDGYCTVLDQTAFFPEGGGQPSDIGLLNNTEVYHVKIVNGTVFHYTKSPFLKGENVNGTINFKRRFDFMQQHSAEHIVSGIAHKLYGCENVGFHLSEDIVTLDFDKYLEHDQILNTEQLANRKIWENVRFNCYYPESEALNNLNYRCKKELKGDIRIVEIKNTDICACCAPHVKTAGQIGLIKLLGTEKLRGGIRIELKAGNRALCDFNEKYHNIRKISTKLAITQSEVYSGVEKLLNTINDQKSEITSLKYEVLRLKTENFVPKSKISAIFETNLSFKDLQVYADTLRKMHGGIRVVFSPIENGFAFAACGDNSELFFQNFKSAFNVKGGGRNGMVQGTVTADRSMLECFFEKAD